MGSVNLQGAKRLIERSIGPLVSPLQQECGPLVRSCRRGDVRELVQSLMHIQKIPSSQIVGQQIICIQISRANFVGQPGIDDGRLTIGNRQSTIGNRQSRIH